MLSELFKKDKITTYLFIIILLLGAIVRVWRITSLPLPPNGDELAYGYYGWSFLHFGTDEYGNRFPLYPPSIGDYKYPTLAYLNMIPAFFFGLSEITVRFWPVISGIILIGLTFTFSYLLFKSHFAAVSSAFFMSFSPWGITLSRVAYGTIIGITLATLVVVLILNAARLQELKAKIKQRKNPTKLFVISFVLLVISSFSYGSLRIFIPSFLFCLLLISFLKNSPFKRFCVIIFPSAVSQTKNKTYPLNYV